MSGDWTVSSYPGEFSPDTKQNLRDLYSGRCAVCRQRRESPFGHPETEAAHVHPARHGGPDRESNGLLLCRRCHRGFDSGWLSLQNDCQIVVADDSAPGHEYFNQFRDRSIATPGTPDLGPAPRFVEVHRKISGFDSICEGDWLTFGGLRSGETRLVDGRRVRVRGAPDDALAVNCRVTDVGAQRVRCAHLRPLETRSVTDVEPVDTPSADVTTWSFERLSNRIQAIKDDHSGVRQKWEWGRIFRRIRVDSRLSRDELAEQIDVPGTSTLQIERSEGVYEAFPDGGFADDGLSYSAIAELQRVFDDPDDVRAAYDCIVETGKQLTVKQTRAWVELLMADNDVTRETVREKLNTFEELRRRGLGESVRRILDIHAEYESTYGRT